MLREVATRCGQGGSDHIEHVVLRAFTYAGWYRIKSQSGGELGERQRDGGGLRGPVGVSRKRLETHACVAR